jgi:hypothetical protein
MYISISECGLSQAQKFIKALTTELELDNPEKFGRGNKRDIGFDFGFPNWSQCSGQLNRFQLQCADPPWSRVLRDSRFNTNSSASRSVLIE